MPRSGSGVVGEMSPRLTDFGRRARTGRRSAETRVSDADRGAERSGCSVRGALSPRACRPMTDPRARRRRTSPRFWERGRRVCRTGATVIGSSCRDRRADAELRLACPTTIVTLDEHDSARRGGPLPSGKSTARPGRSCACRCCQHRDPDDRRRLGWGRRTRLPRPRTRSALRARRSTSLREVVSPRTTWREISLP